MPSSAASTPRAGGLFDEPWVRRLLLLVLATAMLSFAISVAGRWYGHSLTLAGHSDDLTLREIVIGNDVLQVPSNAIRFEPMRRDGVTARLDLYLAWPSLEGYSDANRDIFNNAAPEGRIVFVSVEERVMSREMSGRFEPIYSALVTDDVRELGPALVSQSFTVQSGYTDEELVMRTSEPRLVARCLTGEGEAMSSAPCESDIHFGRSLSATYRFSRALLPVWPEVEAAIRKRLNAYIVDGAG